MFQLVLEKAEEPEIKLPTSIWSSKEAREFQKNICFCFIDFASVYHNKLKKILKEMGIPDHLTCLLRNLYAGQETAVRTGHGKTDWFQIGKGVLGKVVYGHCLFNLYTSWEINRVTIHNLSQYSFPNLEPVCCSISSSNCCFLTCIQISQEEGKVVLYSHLFKNFLQFVVIHTSKSI